MGSRLRRLLRPSDWRHPPSLLRQVRELCQLQDENTHRKQLVIGLALICHILLPVIRKNLNTARRVDVSQCPPRESSRKGKDRSQYNQN
jgi:hypothetical protein